MYKEITVSNAGTEYAFITELVTKLEDCGFSCTTDLDEFETALTDTTDTNIPLVFEYGDYTFSMKRANSFNSSNYIYYIIFETVDNTFFSASCQISSGTSAAAGSTTRALYLNLLVNGDNMSMVFYNINKAFVTDIYLTKIDGNVCYAYTTSSSSYAVNGNIIDTSTSTVYTLNNALSFTHSDPTNMFILRNKKLMSGSSYFSDSDLLDCSTVTGRTLIAIDGVYYLALGPNTLIPVEESDDTDDDTDEEA